MKGKGLTMRNFSNIGRLLGVCGLVLLLATGLLAQTTSLSGTVSDPSGALVPNASIAVSNVKTGVSREITSDSQGRYTLAQLTPGTYKLTAKASGFAEKV